MRRQLAWMVGGQQGEGIDSTGVVLSGGLNRMGYFLYGYRTFSSRIKGGHTNYKITISTRRVLANQDNLDILVAFDQETVEKNVRQLRKGGILLADSSDFRADLPDDSEVRLVEIPLTKMAEDLGTRVIRNMVATGATAALLGLELRVFDDLIVARWGNKGEKIVNLNKQAVRAGHDYVREQAGDAEEFRLAPGDRRARYLMSGDQAVAFGALVAGCRIMAAYPITPATDVMEWLVKKLPEYGGVVLQSEDEIAAITAIIGAGYAGARAMTCTSGPGFSLMMEGLGYAGMTEIPIVIVDTQRAGPSTGMPTKHEQSDLNQMVYGSHGDLARVVIAPTTVEECFTDTVEAFNLAERYQCPVIVALDFALATCVQTVEDLPLETVAIDRGRLADPEELKERSERRFPRYAFTESGISPRTLPGMENGLYLATGSEHRETGQITEDPINRVKMMDKRTLKVLNIPPNGNGVHLAGEKEPDVLLVGWGSTTGPIQEAADRLRAEGLKVGQAQVHWLSPFPKADLEAACHRAGKVVVIENNALGQLATYLRAQGIVQPLISVTKYDGIPFVPAEVTARVKEVL